MSSPNQAARATGPVLAVFAGLIWAGWYVWSVGSNARHDDNALVLIGPLFWVLLAIGGIVVAQAFVYANRGTLEDTIGLQNTKRKSYLFALAALLLTLPWLGFLGSGLPFFLILAWWLGFRRPGPLGLAALIVVALFAGAFNAGLDIDLPLGPDV